MTKQKKRAVRRLMPLPAALSALVLAGTLMAAPVAHAGFDNGGFEEGDLTSWTVKQWSRTVGPSSGKLEVPVPTTFADLKLQTPVNVTLGTGTSVAAYTSNLPFIRTGAENSLQDDTRCGNGGNAAACNGDNSAPGLTLPRWGSNVVRIGGHGARKASSIEQTAAMTVADIDPVDGKIHVRFAMAPIMYDEGHPGEDQPYFFVEVKNVTKGTSLFTTYNFVGQSGVPWQTNGNYKYTDWQGFDISPGNGLLDVGDEVTLSVYVANCAQGGAGHTSLVYLDAVGAFMPGLAVHAVGPTSTQPGSDITYTYSYVNNSGVFALGSKVDITTPFTADNRPLTFGDAVPGNCTGPHTHTPASRGQYITCDVGDLANNQGGSLDVKFKVPAGATTTAPDNVINNGDYNIYANAVSPYLGPLVKTDMPPLFGGKLVDLGVTVDNGGKSVYTPGESFTYIVNITNHGDDATEGTVTQTLTGLGNDCSAIATNPVAATCAPDSAGVKITFLTGSLNSGDFTQYTVTGTAPAAGTTVNTIATVAVTGPNVDNNTVNNTAGLNTPTQSNHALTVNTSGNGAGHVLSTDPALACGNAITPCDTTGKTQNIAEGQEVRFTPVPHTGSMFKSWTGCDSVEGTICVTTMGTGNMTVTANFVDAVVVTPKVDPSKPGGSISPGPAQVEKGTTTPPSFTITPNPGKYPELVTGGNSCAGSMTGPDGSGDYSYVPAAPVDADCEFTVAFSNTAPNMVPEIKLPGPITVGQPYNKGELTCTNVGTAQATDAACTVAGLPPGLTLGQCMITPPIPAVAFVSQPVPVGGVISCPITGTPTGGPGTPTGTAEWDDPDNPGTKKNNQVGANGGIPGSNVPVLQASPVPVDNPFALLLLALGLLGLGSRYARKRVA